jgi:hypothetical protein
MHENGFQKKKPNKLTQVSTEMVCARAKIIFSDMLLYQRQLVTTDCVPDAGVVSCLLGSDSHFTC